MVPGETYVEQDKKELCLQPLRRARGHWTKASGLLFLMSQYEAGIGNSVPSSSGTRVGPDGM